MIDIDELEKLCKYEINRGTANPYTVNENPIHAMQELITRLRQAEKDAARYRWLRESASTEDHGGFAYNFRLVDAIRYMPGAAPNETMGIDDAIDEAMQCK